MVRVAFQQMLDAAERGEFERLIVYKWDRFGRNAATHVTIADLESIGVTVMSATEGDDFLSRGVGLLVSESYSRQLSQRVQDSMKVRFKQNHSFMGGPTPYGYKTVRGTDDLSRLVIDPEESEVVRKIFKWSSKESMGDKRVARRLSKMGIKTRGGKDWSWTTIHRILRRELYIGKMVYGKNSDKLDRRTGKIKRIRNEKYLTFTDESLRIISDAEFESVRERHAQHCFRDYRIPKDVRAFSSVVTCGCCGNVMYTRHQGLYRKTVTYYMVCGRRDRFGIDPDNDGCSNPFRPTEQAMLSLVQESIRKVLQHKDRIIKRAMEIAEKALDTNDQQRALLTAELSKVQGTITRFGRMLRDPSLSDEQTKGLLSQIGALEGEKDVINTNLRQLGDGLSFDKRALIREVNGAMEEAEQQILQTTNTPLLNRAIQRFCGKIIANQDGTLARATTSNAVSRR